MMTAWNHHVTVAGGCSNISGWQQEMEKPKAKTEAFFFFLLFYTL